MNTVELHYRRLGPIGSPTLILLHGLFGSSDNLGSVAKELAEPTDPDTAPFDVLMVDLRDHGRSPHTEGTSYPIMAEDVHALVVSLELKDLYLVGHSMGGKVAMVFAQRWPELMKQLVVIDISPREHENDHGHIIDAILTADISQGRSRKEVEAQIAEKVKEPGVVQFLMKNLYWKNEDQFGWRVNAPLLDHDLHAILAAIGPQVVRVPTLFIRGGASDYIQREDLPAIKEQFPNSKVETIPYAGHWVHAQAPDEVVALIRALA